LQSDNLNQFYDTNIVTLVFIANDLARFIVLLGNYKVKNNDDERFGSMSDF